MPHSDTAVATRQSHPIIQSIDAKMPEIAAMLPEGMNADRFRRVVVQALVKNPELWDCTPISVVTAIVEAAETGLEPTGVLGRAWLIPYRNKGVKEAKFIAGYRGYAELAWRADRILVTTGAVRTGDEFSYRRGTDAFLHHNPAADDAEREADDANITDFWAMYTLPDGRKDFDVMSRKAVEKIRARARGNNPVWDSDFGEMGRKTVLRRLLKIAPLSPQVQRVLARDEEIDFDTPVERVPDPKREGLTNRISQRAAALRGEPNEPVESDAGVPTGGAEPAGVREASALPAGGSTEAPRRDPWMARLHAVGSERGMDHDALHDWAVERFHVTSLTELSTPDRADLMEMVERLPLLPNESTAGPAVTEAAGETPPSSAASEPPDALQERIERANKRAAAAKPKPGSPQTVDAPEVAEPMEMAL